ncbi:MAG TPA: flagellum-specific ATP synthase FliI, partial [Rhodocyclaceae bacterium]|nr:flagellum-specific ATP synthase FliI [Rhodocyclaceae bacterium]
ILDGHFVLNRSLADAGHYPAIDIEQSISRVMTNIITPEHLDLVRLFKQLYSRYQRARDLLAVGAYAPGSDPLLDRAIQLYPRLEAFLQQRIDERASYGEAIAGLAEIFGH